VKNGITRTRLGLKALYPLAQGGTAVGTGLNAKPQFAKLVDCGAPGPRQTPIGEAISA
jgi:fumarate hydratase, class II